VTTGLRVPEGLRAPLRAADHLEIRSRALRRVRVHCRRGHAPQREPHPLRLDRRRAGASTHRERVRFAPCVLLR